MKLSLAIPLSLAAVAAADFPHYIKSNGTAIAFTNTKQNDTASAAPSPPVRRGIRSDPGHRNSSSPDQDAFVFANGTINAFPRDAAVPILPTAPAPAFAHGPALVPPKDTTFVTIDGSTHLVPTFPKSINDRDLGCYVAAVHKHTDCDLWDAECICSLNRGWVVQNRAKHCVYQNYAWYDHRPLVFSVFLSLCNK